jgi:hypothetical protein
MKYSKKVQQNTPPAKAISWNAQCLLTKKKSVAAGGTVTTAKNRRHILAGTGLLASL